MTEKGKYLGPQVDLSKVRDYRFRDSIEYPWSTYEQTMMAWGNGWEGGYDTSTHVDAMVQFAADAFVHFGGNPEGQIPLAAEVVVEEEVLRYLGDNQGRFGVYAFEREIASVVIKYLRGEGEDYEALVSWL